MWFIHTVEYYPALKRKEVLTSATMWMNLEDVMLREARHRNDSAKPGSRR